MFCKICRRYISKARTIVLSTNVLYRFKKLCIFFYYVLNAKTFQVSIFFVSFITLLSDRDKSTFVSTSPGNIIEPGHNQFVRLYYENIWRFPVTYFIKTDDIFEKDSLCLCYYVLYWLIYFV